MATILLPKYSIGQINQNFASRPSNQTLTQFVAANFSVSNGSIAALNPKNGQIVNQIPNSLLNSIMTDYGNGPISKGLASLQLINQNVLSDTQNKGNVFNQSIIYGAEVDFKNVTTQQGEVIVNGNLSMLQIINVAPSTYQTQYYAIVDAMVSDIKNAVFDQSKYSTSLISICKKIAQAVSRTLNSGTSI